MLMTTMRQSSAAVLLVRTLNKRVHNNNGMTVSHFNVVSSRRQMASTPLSDYKVKPVVIDKNLKLWTVTSVRSLNNMDTSEAKPEKREDTRKKLMILFAYMLPNEKHLDKYRRIYYDHGFDVLTVQTSPMQFFFPRIGAQIVADHVYQFIERLASKDDNKYPDVLIHAFSVGGYQFAEFLNRLYKSTDDRKSHEMKQAIKGAVFDSPCDVGSVPYGLSRTIAGNTLLASLIEAMVNLTRRIFYPFSTKYHLLGEETFMNRPLQCPALFFASKTDKMADISVIEKTVDVWSGKGVDVKLRYVLT